MMGYYGASHYVADGAIIDSFNRADSDTLGMTDTGQAWVDVGSSKWSISGGAAYQASKSNVESWTEVGYADMFASITFSGAVNYQTFVVRYTPPWNTGTGYRVTSDGTISTLARRVPGQSQTLHTFALSLNDRLGVSTKREAGGVRVKLYRNDALIYETLDITPVPDGTKVGLVNVSSGNANAGASFDDLEIVPS